MIKGLVSISENDLKKNDKSGLKTLYLYWLENDKKMTFDLPLFVDTNGKGVLSVECFKRVFFAFCGKCGIAFDCEIVSGSDGDDGSYNVVRLSASPNTCKLSDDWLCNFEEPKVTDQKRESSKTTRDKSKAKKAEAKKEADALADDFAKSHAKKIADLVMGKYGLKLSAEKLSSLENDLIAILKM